MGRNPRLTVICFVGICLVCGWPNDAAPHATAHGQDSVESATPPADAAQAQQEYQQWVERNSLNSTSLAGLKLVITAVEGEEKANDVVENQFGTGITSYGCKVSADGAVSHFYYSDFGRKGGSGNWITPADLKRIDAVLAKLPDDGSRLPAAGRRVIVQAARVGQEATTRVYDRANAPVEILELIRLSQAQIRVWLPEFKPQGEIDARRHNRGGFLCLSPDGTQIIFTCTNGPLQFWEPITHEPLGEIRRNPGTLMDAITYNLDASLAVLSGWGDCELVDTKKWKRIKFFTEPYVGRKRQGLTAPRFTPDGKYLVLQCSEPALRIFDTATWERVARLPGVPEDTVRYIPAPRKKRAVVQSKNGTISLWDLERNESVAELDKGCSLSEAVFAPDETQFAVVTNVAPNQARLRIWNTDTGEFLHELRPFEQYHCEKLGVPFWSPDGQYLLAATKAHVFFTSEGISVWNVKTGRHRGEFVGCPTDVNGVALLPDGSQLVAGCADGKIRFWDFPAVIKQIRGFENSLEPVVTD